MSRRKPSIELSSICPWLREMHILDGLLNRRQSVAGAQRNRQDLLRLGSMGVQQAFHEHPHLPGGPAFGFVVYGNDPPHMQRRFGFRAYHFVLRDFHLHRHKPLRAGYHPPGQHDARPNGEDRFKERLIKEHRLEPPGGILHHYVEDGEAATAGLLGLASDDRAADRGLRPRHQLSDRGHDRAIFIPPG